MTTRAPANQFQRTLESHAGMQSSLGVVVTPGNNTYGTYVQMMTAAQVTEDAYGILINVNSNAISGSARDTILKFGFDPAGGTAYTDIGVDLLVSCAGILSGVGLGGISYYFPLYIKAGTSIGVAASVNTVTLGTMQAFCRLSCAPSHPLLVRVGSFVRTFGSTPASSSGTAITPNAVGSKSAYVQLGSATAEALWWWNLGVGCNNQTMSNNGASWDLALGASGSQVDVIRNMIVLPTTGEILQYQSLGVQAAVPSGTAVWARAGTNVASPSGMSAAAYAVGG